MNSQQRLVHLSLAENGHLFKGTFLCFGQPNQIQTISQSATESKFILFKGTVRAHILALETVNGHLIRQYERMMLLLCQHIPLGQDREKNEHIYEIPIVALREFVTNAFVHHNYSQHVRSYIQVEIYDDRIEIKSSGHLPDNVDVNKIEGTVLVNPTIAAVFYLYKYIQNPKSHTPQYGRAFCYLWYFLHNSLLLKRAKSMSSFLAKQLLFAMNLSVQERRLWQKWHTTRVFLPISQKMQLFLMKWN